MHLLIHRGSREIGGSCVELKSGDTRLIVDIGMQLVDKHRQPFDFRQFEKLSGPELVKQDILPDIPGLYQWETGKPVDAVLLSHPHLDHYGLFQYIRPDTPFFMGEAAKRIVDLTVLFTGKKGRIARYVPLKSNQPVTIGDFTVTPYLMDHSAFDAYAFLIEAGGKKVFYSGDFRSHGRKGRAFKWFLRNAPKKIDALLMEGTMLGRDTEKVITEEEIEQKAVSLVKSARNTTLIYLSSQNIDRLVTFARVAMRLGKLFAIDFYTAHILDALKDFAKLPFPSRLFPNIRVYYPYYLSRRMVNQGKAELLYQFKDYKISKAEITAAGSDAMVLTRPSMLTDLLRIGSLENGLFIYSLWEGYLKDAAMQKLKKFTDGKGMVFETLHTSGHADRKTLQEMVDRLKPETIIPIHTFFPAKYRIFGRPVRIVRDKQPVTL